MASGTGSSTSSANGPTSTTTAGTGGGVVIPGEVLFFDDFEYVADRYPASGDAFLTEGGWTIFKDRRTSMNAGGYLYTTTSVSGFGGTFPGAASSRVLAIESRVGTEAPDVGGWHQTDFYLGLGYEGPNGMIGDIPANVWFQFWMYQNDYGAETSRYSRSDKWLYPTRSIYPAVEGELSWLFTMGTGALEPTNTELGPGPDRFMKVIGSGADFTAASEYPTNMSKLGHNLGTSGFVSRNQWTLVKIHFDTSGAEGVYESWIRPAGGTFTKVAEWIGGSTANFTWPIPADHRDGHKQLRMPTTMNMNAGMDGGDSWTYLDDFAMATSESALPMYP